MTLPRLSTAQAAARLGIKHESLYAYVSRGIITSDRDERGGSTFDALDVEALAAARAPRQRRAAGSAADAPAQGTPLMVVESDLTTLQDDELYFRGLRATDLASRASYERVADLLWTGRLSPQEEVPPFESDASVVAGARAAAAQLGPSAGVVDRLVVAVLVAASGDPLRHELAPESVRAAGRRMIACAVEALPTLGTPPDARSSIAARLWPALSAERPDAADLELVNAALVLGMDHDLAVSTLAARVAASARSDPYSAIVGALSAFDGPLHGAASGAAFTMLTEVMETNSPERALARQVQAGHGTPGFGHVIYRRHDPRAEYLLDRMRRLPRYAPAVHAVDQLAATVQSRLARPANVDLALAALAAARGMGSDAGQTVFAVARMAGWLAHIMDEYIRAPLRLRPQSRYVGVAPRS